MSDFTTSVDSPLSYMSESSNSSSPSSSSSTAAGFGSSSSSSSVSNNSNSNSNSNSNQGGFLRWSLQEQEEIRIIRQRLGPLLTDRPQYPDVVGDRKIVRYLRGHEHNLDKVVDFMRNTLKWRDETNMDTVVRHNILHGGFDLPTKFPKGDVLTSIIPGIPIHHKSFDKKGCPVCVDTYNFSPGAVLAAVTQEEYITFMIYVFEYRSLILEQLSEEREAKDLAALIAAKKDPSSTPPYGLILQTCVIRDLSGIGLEFMGSAGKSLLRSVVTIASNNYPETLRKSLMIKTPWLFNTIWYFIKGFITTRTVDKVSIIGWSYMDEVEVEIEKASIPAMIGGPLPDEPGTFSFNLTFLDAIIGASAGAK